MAEAGTDRQTQRSEIGSSRSFGSKVFGMEDLSQAVATYIARATEKLRARQLFCGAVHLFLQTDRFRPDEPQYSNGLTIPLQEPTDNLQIFTAVALRALEDIFLDGFRYKRAGVQLRDLRTSRLSQGSLFAEPASGNGKASERIAAAHHPLGRIAHGARELILGTDKIASTGRCNFGSSPLGAVIY